MTVVNFTGITTLDSDPDRILEAAVGKLETVVVLGFAKDGTEYFVSSVADGGTVTWLMDRAKRHIHDACDEMADTE